MPQDDFSRSTSPHRRIDRLAGEEKARQQGATNTPEQRMIDDIRQAYQAESHEDARSLERVLSRLVEGNAAGESKILYLPQSSSIQERMPEMHNTMNSLAHERSRTVGGWTRRWNLFAAFLVLALLVGGFLTVLNAMRVRSTGSALHPAPSIYNRAYMPVDGVYCDQLEQTKQHIHVQVSMYIDGKLTPIPADVGIPLATSGNPVCFYWLHTHDASGVIHIETPTRETFTFGQFRDEWYQKFQRLGFPSQLLRNNGWTIWVNGHRYAGTLEHIPLTAHSLITLAYNSPNVKPGTSYAWDGL